jgi:hypothetical protein
MKPQTQLSRERRQVSLLWAWLSLLAVTGGFLLSWGFLMLLAAFGG